MSFPNRPGRLEFGPLALTERPAIVSTDKDLSAAQASLMMWQLAGVGLSTPRAWAMVTYAASTYTVAAWGSAFRPDDQLVPKPAPTRTGAGVFSVAYPATILDKDGNAIPTQLYGAVIVPQGLFFRRAAQEVDADGRTVKGRLWDSAGAAVDNAFMLFVW